jgi:hypothetical protein
MKIKRFFLFGLPVLLLALGLVLAGCGGDDDEDGGGGDGLNLPELHEPTTGLKLVSNPIDGISLTGLPLVLAETTDDKGVKFSIEDGKFLFRLPENPATQKTLTNWGKDLLEILFYDKAANGYTTTPNDAIDATFASVTGIHWNDDSASYSVFREAVKTDEETYEYSSKIVYVYVNKDVTLSRTATTLTNTQIGAVNLALKTGWNLVQTDRHITASGGTVSSITITVKIADKDVPWTLDVDEKK